MALSWNKCIRITFSSDEKTKRSKSKVPNIYNQKEDMLNQEGVVGSMLVAWFSPWNFWDVREENTSFYMTGI